MISHMKSHVEGKPQPKMWMYSAHDSTIANLLNTLQVFELQNPPYSSAVLMELRADSSGNHHVYVSINMMICLNNVHTHGLTFVYYTKIKHSN